MDNRKCPPDNDKGLRAVGIFDTLIELALGASIMIVFAFILFVFVRTNFNVSNLSASVPGALKAPKTQHKLYQGGRVL